MALHPVPSGRPPAIAIIARRLKHRVAALDLDQRLDAAGLDNVDDRYDLALELEEQLGLAIDQDAPERWVTVRDVIESCVDAAEPGPFDFATTAVAASWRANERQQSVTVELRFPGRFTTCAALPIAGVGLSFADKQKLAENLAFRLNLSSACKRGP